ncbi:GNAT family N-acetyltransferase [Nostoc sp. UCD121]|uniref:GNAT family N-acetyltransferase n=1 Tax=unclassified Nostoc TaxID=2593658 RepID=UPI00162553F9|nr:MULTISPECIES: GNAT family N-acetyltransferase [unclassified Nostoc]MBC1218455.1 GNAT family N-acetyltransferase [Nostoc sp. UCD120]MBC1277708.1 GNAT family N-acetyltransferase [Nostoc sp. UCD121]MBC1295977.1 GNAT family N-acetyltransferase [Nostoc sp. UCD122]
MLKIIQVEADEHKSQTQKLFWEYFNETKLIFSHQFGINLDANTFFEQYMTQLHEFIPPSGRLFLAQYETQIVGCACLRKIGENIGEIKRMYVRPEFRRKGIGRTLLETIINEASNIGYSKIRLDSAPFAKQAQALYRVFGFRDIEPYLEKTEIPLEYRANWVFMELVLK